MKERIIFVICCTIIVLVATVDIYWIIKNSEVILEYEKNHKGTWLIKKENGFYIAGTDPRRDGTVRGK